MIVHDSLDKGNVVTVSEQPVAGFASDLLNDLDQVTQNL